jgi:hypothetical protein
MDGISFRSRCTFCDMGGAHAEVGCRGGQMLHKLRTQNGALSEPLRYVTCSNWDDECRSIGEPFGFYTFAWLPVKCRNGKRRWLCDVERHRDGTYTLGNRAH